MFGRWRAKDPSSTVTDFWRWWASARDRVAAAIPAGTTAELADELGQHVEAIHPDLQWELAKGAVAQHSLVVAPGGDARLRAVVARWLAAAPPADGVFEYHGSRQPDDRVFESRMQIEGHTLELAELRFAFTADDDRHAIDVAVYHPVFPSMAERAQLQVTFLALDWALGEEQVELWVGQVAPQPLETDDLRSGRELRAAIAELAARHTEPRFVMLSWQTPRGPAMAVVQLPLRAARWPRFDTHVSVSLQYPARDNGLPTDESLTRLREAEDRGSAVLADHGTLVAHETSNGLRTLHFYVDGPDTAKAVADAVRTATSLRVTEKTTYDPALEQVGHLRP